MPLNHPFLDGIFPNKNHPAMGVPPFMETHIYLQKNIYTYNFVYNDNT